MATINADKLTLNFAQAAEFRFAGKKIDLEKATDQITVKDKHGNDKVIKGFQAADGTFFRLKKTAGGGHQINVYGTPDQLAKSNLQVRGGEVTGARFGDERFRKTDPQLFNYRDFEFTGSTILDRDTFEKLHGLQRRTPASLDAGKATQSPAPMLSAGPADADPKPAIGSQPDAELDPAKDPGTKAPAESAFQPPVANAIDGGSPGLVWDSTPIDASNREALKDHVGYGEFFRNPDRAFSDRLTSYLAVLTGRDQPPAGTSPLDLLDDGQLTLGDLKAAIDQLSVSMGSAPQQDPIAVLAVLGREPIPTLADGNCLYAALAHSLGDADAMDRDAALEQRQQLKDVFQIAKRNPAQIELIAGRADAKSIDRVDGVLSAGLGGERVDADGWGGPESLKLAAMQSNRPIVTVSDEGVQIFDPRGGVTRFEASAIGSFRAVYDGLDAPVVLMLKGFHWQATAPLEPA